MNTDIANVCQCYGLYDKDNIIGFCAVLHQPNAKNSKIKRVSRLVILPDYQGIGLGTKFLNEIAKIYINQNFDFSIVTSAKNMIFSLRKSKNWNLIRYSKIKPVIDKFGHKYRGECYTASFMYKK